MDVSNASGYDGTTVAADACFVAKARDRPREGRRHRGDEPAGAPGREDVRARLRARGRRGAARRRRDRSRRACARRPHDAAAVIFQQPNFFGCLEPAPDLAAAANDGRRAADRARRPDQPRRARGAGQLRLRARDRRGPVGRQRDELRRPALRLPRRARRATSAGCPGRIVGETVDAAGERGYRAHAADARAAHPAREGDLEHHHQPDAARARGARAPLAARPAGAARDGGDLHGARRLREGAARGARARARCSPSGRRSRSSPCASDGTRRDAIRDARARGVNPGYPLGRDYPGLDDALLVAVTEKRTAEEIDRLAEALGIAHEADLREVAGRAAAGSACRSPTCRCRRCPAELARTEPPRLPELAEPEVLRHFTELSTRNFGIDTGFYPLGSCTMKYNPRVNERLVGAPGLPRPAPARRRRRGAGRARARVAASQEILREVTGPRRGQPPAGRRAARAS